MAEMERAGVGEAEAEPFVALDESDFREAFYSHAGGYDQAWLEPGAPRWLASLRAPRDEADGVLAGRNTYLEVSRRRLVGLLPWLGETLAAGLPGTRVTVVAEAPMMERLQAAGFELLWRVEADAIGWDVRGWQASIGRSRVVMCGGRRHGASRASHLDHAAVRPHMDPRDRGEGVEPAEAKAARASGSRWSGTLQGGRARAYPLRWSS